MKARQGNRFSALRDQMKQSLKGVQNAKERLIDDKDNNNLTSQVEVFSSKLDRLRKMEEQREIEKLKDQKLLLDIQQRQEQREFQVNPINYEHQIAESEIPFQNDHSMI